MTAPITVRPAQPDDFDALRALTLAAYEDLLGTPVHEGYAAELADVAGRAEVVDVLVAVDPDGTLVGGVAYVPGPGPLAWFDGQDEAGMRMLAVAPAAQGRGVGAALVVACVNRAVAARKRRLLLHTTPPMTTAQRLYERAGFHRDPDHEHVFDSGFVLMAYALDLGPSASRGRRYDRRNDQGMMGKWRKRRGSGRFASIPTWSERQTLHKLRVGGWSKPRGAETSSPSPSR